MIKRTKPYSKNIREKVIKDYHGGMSYRAAASTIGANHKTIMKWIKNGRTRKEAYKLESAKLKGIHRSPNTEFQKGQIPWNKGAEMICIRGEKHPNWMGGERKYPYKFKEVLKEKIRNRDLRKCKMCNETEKNNERKLDVHHIDYNKNNCDENNLITLCVPCHTKTGFNRDKWKKYFEGVLL